MCILGSWRKAGIIALGLWTGACPHMPSNHPLHLKTKKVFDLDLLGHELGIESPPRLESPGTQAPIMRAPHPAVCGSPRMAGTVGSQFLINSRPPQLERLRSLLPIQACYGWALGRPGPSAIAMSWVMVCMSLSMPGTYGRTLDSMTQEGSDASLLTQKIRTSCSFARLAARPGHS